MKKRNTVLSFIFYAILSAFGIGLSPAVAENAKEASVVDIVSSDSRQIVSDFQAVLIDVMKLGETISFEERHQKLKGAILESHDVLKSLRTIVGSKEWRRFSKEQKDTLTELFINFIVSTYAYNFNEFAGESFVYVSEHTTKKGNIIVRSILKIPEGKRKKVTFDYALKKNSESWRIYNIAADGVSDLATRRSEYRRILAGKDGFNTLIAIINKKIDNYTK